MPDPCIQRCWEQYDLESKAAFDAYQQALQNCNGNQACEATAAHNHAAAQALAAQHYAECISGCG